MRAAAKIPNLCHVLGPNEDVVGLEVAVHDVLMVCMGKSFCDLLTDEHPFPVLGKSGNEVGQRSANAVLSDHIVSIFIDDVAVIKFEDIGVV